jgi:proteasome lid subunit RPN8/RPN11
MTTDRPIIIDRSVVDSILQYARANHPREAILLLNGKATRAGTRIDGVEIPPLAVHGSGFSQFPLHMLPIDFSVVGTAHSHPSGFPQPSVQDLNNFYGRVMIIAASPYESADDLVVFNSKGEQIRYIVVEESDTR